MSGKSTNNTSTGQEPEQPDLAEDPLTGNVEGAPEGASGRPVHEEVVAESEIEQLRQQVEQQKQVVADSREKVLRAQAELDNMRKRTARDVENAHKYALDKFISDLLPILDSMELGIDASASADDMQGVKEGMELTMKMFSSTLEKFGVKVIDPQNERFNPELHEAVSMQEQAGAKSGTVIGVMQKGYELNGRLVRPAKVIVAK